jgi:parallel beta-helix repeat protein
MEVRLKLLMSLMAAAIPAAATASQFYVSTTGNDSATGSVAAPWRTLQHAADVVGPGDTVIVTPGNYAGFDLRHSGASAAPISFQAQSNVFITSASQVRKKNGIGVDGINLEGASYVVVDGFNINGMPEAAVRAVGFPDDFARFVTVRNITTSNNGVWGIFTGHVDDLLIESNSTSGSVDQHGIYVSNSGDRPIIRNNVSYNNHDNGIHMNGDLSQGGDGIISGAIVSGNMIYNNGTGGGCGINMDGVQDSRIENNLLYNNHASGISLYDIDGADGSKRNLVVNNTIIEASDARWALNILDGSSNNTARNNILLNNNTGHGSINIDAASLAGFVSDYNVVVNRFSPDDGASFQTLAQWQALTGNDTHSIIATASALFANVVANDYHLKVSSPAINAGTNVSAPPGDLAGLPRPAGGAFDIGAYEFGALSGDYNRDGRVDARDFIIWRDTLGTMVSRYSGADGDGSGVIDQADYARWRAGFGVTADRASGSLQGPAIPEPAAFELVCLTLLLLERFQYRASGTGR